MRGDRNALSARAKGDRGEEAVCRYLAERGYEIVVRNFTIRGGEIDLIARMGAMLAFVEVKTRKPHALTAGGEAVTITKRRRITKAAERFLAAREEFADCCGRFDVAVVTADDTGILGIEYYEEAFDACR